MLSLKTLLVPVIFVIIAQPVKQGDSLLQSAKKLYIRDPGEAIALAAKVCNTARRSGDHTAEIQSLNLLGQFYLRERKNDSAKIEIGQAMHAAGRYRIDSLQGDSWLLLGIIDHTAGRYGEAIEKYQRSILCYKVNHCVLKTGKSNLNIGICMQQLANYQGAINYYLSASDDFDRSGDRADLANTYNSIALCFVSLVNYPSAILYNRKALAIRELLKDTAMVAQSFSNIGFAFNQENRQDSAVFYLRQSLLLRRNEKDSSLIIHTLQNLGSAYLAKRYYTLAGRYVSRSLVIAVNYGQQQAIAQGNLDLGELYLDRRKYGLALGALNITEKVAKQLKLPELLMAADRDKYELYLRTGDLKNVIYYGRQKDLLKDSLFSAARDKAINELEIRYRASLNQKDIAALNLQNKLQAKLLSTQKSAIIALLAGAGLLAGLFVIAYKNYRIKEKAGRRIEHLMQELHHRVKNNLQILSGLFLMQIESLDDAAAKNALRENEARLASMNLIHNRLYAFHGDTRIEMEDYLEKLVLHIKRSFGGAQSAVALRANVEPLWIEADKAVAIGLIVNELVTNAFKHAFDGPGGFIELEFKKKGNAKILLRISDNGKGISDLHKENGTSFGIKLVNLMARQLNSSLVVETGKGTACTMEITV